MRIKLSTVFVDDQDKAPRVYTEVLPFVKKTDISVGPARWLTLVSPDEPEGTELVLEPDSNPVIDPATKSFKKAAFDAGIPFTAFFVDDIRAEWRRLRGLGVAFKMDPMESGHVTIAVFDDTCGNLIQLAQRGQGAR